jgi:hypothetical protein
MSFSKTSKSTAQNSGTELLTSDSEKMAFNKTSKSTAQNSGTELLTSDSEKMAFNKTSKSTTQNSGTELLTSDSEKMAFNKTSKSTTQNSGTELIIDVATAPISIHINDLTNVEFAQILRRKYSQLFNATDFSAYTSLGKYNLYSEIATNAHVNHLPTGYLPGFIPGDGLCFVHSLVYTLIVYYHSTYSPSDCFNEMMAPIIDTIRNLMPNQTLILELDTIEFIALDDVTVQELLCLNAKYIHSLVYNLTVAMVHSWYTPQLMGIIRSRLVANGNHTDPIDMDICDFRQNLQIETGKGHMVNDNSRILAVDGIGRLFVMSILGISSIKVHQLANMTSMGNQVEVVERRNDRIYQLQSYTRSAISDTVGGYFLDLDDTQMLMPNRRARVRMGLHSLRSHHYDLMAAYKRGIPVVLCYSQQHDEIPPPNVLPPIDIIRELLQVKPTICIQQNGGQVYEL